MPSPSLRLFLVTISTLIALAALPSVSVAAMSIDEVRDTWPDIHALLEPEEIPFDVAETVDPGSNTNVLRSADGGMYSVALDDDRRFRDEEGRLLDQHPALRTSDTWAGRKLVVASPGRYGSIAVPGEANNSIVFGNSLFDSAEITLRGRRTADPQVGRGFAYYRDVLPGVSQLVVVGTDKVKETLIVERRRDLRFVYDLKLPADFEIRGAERSLQVLNGNNQPIMSITAPVAYDGSGASLALTITRLDRDSFAVEIDGSPRIAYPVAIDPTFSRISIIRDDYESQTDPMSTGRFDLDLCGNYGNEVDDHHEDEASGSYNDCNTSNGWDQISMSSATAARFSLSEGSAANSGLTLRATQDLFQGQSATAKIQAPSGLGIYASVFRGHLGRADMSYSCTLSYVPPTNTSFLELYDAPGDRLDRFWAGRPDGGGLAGAWATFPVTYSTQQKAILHDPSNPLRDGRDPNQHMRGFLGMATVYPPGHAKAGQPLDGQQFEVRYQPSALMLTLTANKRIASADGVWCAADGHWTITFFDDENPTINRSPLPLDAGDPGKRWFKPTEIASIASNPVSHGRAIGAAHDTGSGVRRVRLVNDGEERAWVETCDDLSTSPSTSSNDLQRSDELFSVRSRDKNRPCDMTSGDYVAGPMRLNAEAGRHSLNWRAEDFAGRESTLNQPSDNTLLYFVDDAAPSCTAAWLPSQPQVNGYVRNGSGTLQLTYSDPGYASSPQLGSGVRSVSITSSGDSPTQGINPAVGSTGIAMGVPNASGDYVIRATVSDLVGWTAECITTVHVDSDPPPTVSPEFVRGASGARVRFHPTFDARSGTSHYIWNATDAAGNTLCPSVNRRINQPASAAATDWLESELCQHAPGQEVRYSVRAIDRLDNEAAASTSGFVDSQPHVAITPIDPAESRFQNTADRLFERYSSLAHEGDQRVLPVEVIVASLSDPNGTSDLTDLNPLDVADESRGKPQEYANATVFVRDAVAASPAAGANITWSFGTSATDASVRMTIAEYGGANAASCIQGATGDVRTQFWILDCKESKFDATTGELTVYLIPLVDADGTRPTPDQRYNVRVSVRDRRQAADFKFLRDSATAAIAAIDAAPDFNTSTDIGDTVVDRIAPHVDLIGPNEGQISYVGSAFRTPGIGGTEQSPILDGETYDVNPLSGMTNPTTQYASGVRFVDYSINRWRFDTGNQDATIGCMESSWDRLNPVLRPNDPRSATASTDVPTSDRSDTPSTTTPEPHYLCEFPDMIEGDYAVELCSKDRVGNRSCTNSRLIVDRTAPCAAAPIAVRGATGQRLHFAPVTCDVAGNAVHGTRDLSQVQRYEWKAALTPGVNAPAVCSGVFTQPAAPLPAWLETDLCRNAGVDFTPGTRLYWTLTTFDHAQNNSTATTTETVDIRPVISRPAFENNDVRYDSFNGTVYANGTTSRDLIADVTDRDGREDLDTANDTDPAAPGRGVPTDWAIATVYVTDTLGDDPATPRDDLDASIAVEWAFGSAANPNDATITLHDGSATPPACVAGSAEILTSTYWTMDCSRAVSTPIANGHRLTLPLHPRDNQTADEARYPTPDQRYHVTGFVRDRKQPADYKHLSNAADGATDVDAAPPADTDANRADDVDMGLLVLDRIVPDGVLTYPNVDPITTTSNQNPELRAMGRDVNPGETLAPLSLRDIITSPQTLDPTGMARIEWDVYLHDEDPDQLGPVVAAPDAACKAQDAGNNVERTCMWTGAPFGNYDVTSTLTDIAGNHWTTPKRWLRIEPDVCDNIPGIQPTVPVGFVIDENGDCVRDECPNIDGLQRQVPDGFYKDAAGLCQPDVCPNIDGIQVEIPDGYVKDENGDCVRDICPNVDGIQERVPNGLALNENGDCVPDVCPNIDGNQDRIPNGMVIDENGNCVTPPEPDLCDNIDGIQRQVPNGLVRLPDGRCVPDLCTNIEGVQETVPEGFVRLRGECFRLPPPPPPTDSYQGQYPHVEPLGILNTTMETRNEPEDGFPDDPEDFQIDFGKANLHLQCGRDNATKLIVCPDWNGEFDFTYIGSPAFSWRVRDLSKGDQVDSARGETQFSWSRDSVQDGVTVRDVWTVTKVQAELTVNGVVYPDATIQVVSHTTGGLQNQPQSGYVSLWVWQTADTAQPWAYYAEGAMQVDCQATNNCPDVPVIPDP